MTAERRHQVIRHGLLLDPEKETTVPADILIGGDRFLEIGPPGMVVSEDALEIDATDRLILPGLVNAHTHGHGSLGKGTGDRMSLELLLNAGPGLNGGLTLDDKRTAARLNAAEMVLKGCTACYDMYFEAPTTSLQGITAIGEGYMDVGVRAVVAPMMADLSLYDAIPGLLEALPERHRTAAAALKAAPLEAHIENCRDVLQHWPHDRDRVRPALGPTIPHHCTDGFITACRDLAKEFDVGVQMHLGESKTQAVTGIKRYGRTLVQHLNSLGLITDRFTGAHCIWLDDDDLKLMRDRGASIAHNPGSNLRLGNGIAPARRMLELGVTVGVGSDGSVSADHQNMFEAMRMAAFVSRIVTPDPATWLGSWEVLRLGTTGGAAVLGMADRIGRIAPGHLADLVMLDLNAVAFVPLNDAANQIVNCEDSSAVHSVMIAGRMVLEGRRFTSFDYPGLRRDVQEIVERSREVNAAARARQCAMAEFVSRHCVGLACEGYHVHRRIDRTGNEAGA